MKLRRWLALNREGYTVGAGFTLGRFTPDCLVLSHQSRERWLEDGARFARVYEVSFARMLTGGPRDSGLHVSVCPHGRMRSARGIILAWRLHALAALLTGRWRGV